MFEILNNGSCIYYGCTDPAADNYDPTATHDNNSCVYTSSIPGCTDPNADNYDPSATSDDGSCVYTSSIPGCTDRDADNYDPSATSDDGSCIFSGCTDPNASNYDPRANQDDGSCNIIYCSGTVTLTNPNGGTFNDGSGAPEYGNNSNCRWIIQPTGVNSFALEFTSFFLEAGFDFIRVYDGTTTSAPLLGTFTGINNIPPIIFTSSGAMLVHFTTDGATTSFGWAARYYPITNPCDGISTLDITADPIPSGEYFAKDRIIASTRTVATPSIEMTGGKSIELTPGFDGVSNGQSVVEMMIDPCAINFNVGGTSTESVKTKKGQE